MHMPLFLEKAIAIRLVRYLYATLPKAYTI